MKYRLNPVVFQIKLLILTTMIAVLGFAFYPHCNDNLYTSDATSQAVVFEMQELFDDIEPQPQQDTSSDFLINCFLFGFTALFLVAVIPRGKLTPRLTFLYHVQPRSPPLH